MVVYGFDLFFLVSIGCTRDWIGSKVDARHSWTRNLNFFPFNQAFQVRESCFVCV